MVQPFPVTHRSWYFIPFIIDHEQSAGLPTQSALQHLDGLLEIPEKDHKPSHVLPIVIDYGVDCGLEAADMPVESISSLHSPDWKRFWDQVDNSKDIQLCQFQHLFVLDHGHNLSHFTRIVIGKPILQCLAYAALAVNLARALLLFDFFEDAQKQIL